MFTGIIQYLLEISRSLDGKKVFLCANKTFLDNLRLGDSVAINGVCLTVTEIRGKCCVFELSQETMNKTSFRLTNKLNKKVNVELPLKYGEQVGGHIVSGHVHDVGTFISLNEHGEMWIELNDTSRVEYKGSIAINGISLTIAQIEGNRIKIALIGETLSRTNLNLLQPQDIVNIEFDLSGKLIEQNQPKDDSYFMKLALAQSEKGKVTAPPNPWVGCIITRNNRVVSTGYHKKSGMPHAEVNAIITSKTSLDGCTMYVTLEPCCHQGKTGPCTDVIIKNNIKRVVIGVLDPDEKVSGKGSQILREANIQVDFIEDIDKNVYESIKYTLRQYLYQRTTNLPYVTLKIALSMDGCYVDSEGSSKWITSESSRKEGHLLRSQCQAIIVGAKTAEKDDPELTVRYDIDVEKQPLRIVIDGKSLVSTNNKLFQSKGTKVITTHALCDKWNDIDIEKNVSDDIDLKQVLKDIGVMHCLVEGGGLLHKSFLEEKLVNEIVIFRSSKVFGSDGYRWNIPSDLKLNLVESKIIPNDKQTSCSDVMDRYIVDYTTDHRLNDNNEAYVFNEVTEAVEHFKKGGFVLVMDDEDRENEGDLIVAASKITKSQMTDMINHTTGIICAPMERETAKKLNLPLMCQHNTDKNKTKFTVSIDYVDTTTGVSSDDRLKTVHSLASEKTNPADLRRPGHIFPLISDPEGLNGRQGHTEASIALCKLAGIYPRVAVIGELKNQDGSMKRTNDCYKYAKSNNIPMITVQQLIAAMKDFQDPQFLADCALKSKIGLDDWRLVCFGDSKKPHKVFVYPYNNLNNDSVVPVRIHSECFTGDVFKSKHCDCGEQLKCAMKYITNVGQGVIIFPSDHEGRGIGFVHKVKAYKLQKEEDLDTFEANANLGLDVDARTYDDVKNILKYFGINQIELLTENPDKIKCLGDIVVKTTPMSTDKHEHNKKYLEVKKQHFDSKKEIIKIAKQHNPQIDISNVDVKSLKIAIVYAMWHSEYVDQIRSILKEHFSKMGVLVVDEHEVPGSNEVPFKALKIAEDYDGIVCVGILIKGDTLHFENVSTAVSNGIMQAQLASKTPMMNCVLSCYNVEQVIERINSEKSTLEYIAKSLIKMI